MDETLAPPTIHERVEAIRKHMRRAVQWKGERLAVYETRQHYTNYLRGLPNIKPYRSRLVTLPELAQVFEVLDELEAEYAQLSAVSYQPSTISNQLSVVSYQY